MNTKIFLLSILLFGFSFISYGQIDESTTDLEKDKNTNEDFRKLRIGVYGDASFAWMKPDMDIENEIQYESNGTRIVAGWGLFLDWNFTENYTFSTGFRLGGSGGNLKYLDSISGFSGTVHRKYILKYIEIPLDLKLKTNQIGYFTYFFQIGLRPGFRLSASAIDKYDGTNLPNKTFDISGKDETSFLQFGFNAGIGAEYQISKSFSAFVSLNYRNGMIDVLKGSNSKDTSLKENAFVNSVALSAGFLF